MTTVSTAQMNGNTLLSAWVARCVRLKEGGSSWRTVDVYEQIGRRMLADMGDLPLRKVTVAVVSDWIASLKCAENTRRKYARFASSMFVRAVREGVLKENPFRHAKKQHGASQRDWPYLDESKMTALLAACPSPAWGRMFAMCRWMGLRSSEARALRWDQVDGRTRLATFVARKTGQRRSVPIERRAWAGLGDDRSGVGPCDGLPLSADALAHGAAKISAAAGITDSSPLQAMRKCRSVEWIRQFGSLRAAAWLGHKPSIQMDHYFRVEPADMAAVTGVKAEEYDMAQINGQGPADIERMAG